MAVAGLHNASPFASSLFGESQRASSLLKMWRELEAEHVESPSFRPKLQRNGSDSDCQSTCTSVGNGSENGDDFSQVLMNESENQSLNGSETDQEEDNHSTISGQSSDLGETERGRVRQIFREWMNTGSKGHFHLNNRSEQWLGENECERVRVIREWAQMTAQQKRVGEVGSEIEQVRDGLAISHPRIGGRRPIRRLCGRQTLLDLLHKAQNERKRDLLSLSEQRPVSDFAHRNRIQALLKGRFLRNGRMVLDKRPSSVAATELGLLRQRHTVSDLREGFLSRLDSSASTSVNSAESDSCFGDANNGESESTCQEGEVTETHAVSDLESEAERNSCKQEHEVQVTEAQEPVLVNERIEQEISTDVECQSSRHGEEINVNALNAESVDINDNGLGVVYYENCEPRSGASNVDGEVNDHSTNLERNTNEDFDSHDVSDRVDESEDSVYEIEDNVWPDPNESWQERGFGHSLPWPSYNIGEEPDQMQESHDWPSHDLQEAIDTWLDMPSGEVGESVGRLDTFYFPDDDNVHDIELRELLSRRRVSSLLGSSFRESLNQVLQSHVERLVHASDDDDWELDNTSIPVVTEQNQEQQNGDQNSAPSDGAERNPFEATHPLWDDDLQGAIWPHYNSNQQVETEWDIVNELRLDMARLQERINDMQNMLEACMDMQIELQRSVRQEVSAALNRSFVSTDTCKDTRLHDESQWDHVRKGICCLCRDSKIDSLLYRCGHMCTCTKCAESLVRSKGKCPMCRAPAVEVVRAYFNQ